MNIQTSLKNMCLCRRGEHCLYRAFGLNNVDARGLKKSEIKLQLETYYPEIKSTEIISQNTLDEVQQGHFHYEIKVNGYEQF